MLRVLSRALRTSTWRCSVIRWRTWISMATSTPGHFGQTDCLLKEKANRPYLAFWLSPRSGSYVAASPSCIYTRALRVICRMRCCNLSAEPLVLTVSPFDRHRAGGSSKFSARRSRLVGFSCKDSNPALAQSLAYRVGSLAAHSWQHVGVGVEGYGDGSVS